MELMTQTFVSAQLDPFFLALSRARRQRFDDTVTLCSEILQENPYDQAVWYTKCHALTALNFLDDSELEETDVADVLMDDNALQSMPRPGTSLARPMTNANANASDHRSAFRPLSASGRPLSGFARPGTNSRPTSGASGTFDATLKGHRPGTSSRPGTTLGRQVRLGTASMNSNGASGEFINSNHLDLRKYASRPAVAKCLMDFMLYHDHDPKKALELASEATVVAGYKDWWWKARLGKCYYQLGLFREAEQQFQSSLREQEMIITYLELCKVYLRLDQPNKALDYYLKASDTFPNEVQLQIGIARVYDMLNDMPNAILTYRAILVTEASNVEAIACLASNHFYTDQPELALRYYRRLLQLGVQSTELWCNLGLCCFYASQYDMTLSCFSRALESASDDNMADVWYNIGHVGIGLGDLGLAYQAFKVALSVDPTHAEAYNNLGVLEMRKCNPTDARLNFTRATELAEFLYEPAYNTALVAFKAGDYQTAYRHVTHALALFPHHQDSLELKASLTQLFSAV